MNRPTGTPLHVAIACGGTGGHLFPGLAVGRELTARGAQVTLLVSPKEVDQEAVHGIGLRTATLPAVGLQGGNVGSFLVGFVRAWRSARRCFTDQSIGPRPPEAVLGMGGFTAAPPMLAGRQLGAAIFLHESNTVPGRANRLLARWVREAFSGFTETGSRWSAARTTCTGTPVRGEIARLRHHRDARSARLALGLDPDRPVLLVTGGSQGARGLNQAVCAALPGLAAASPSLQFIHLSGVPDLEAVQAAHGPLGTRSIVRPFLREMHLALEAADAAVSRAGASSLAELAAVGLPSVLIPLPTAQDDHQRHNASALERSGAATRLEQAGLDQDHLRSAILRLVHDEAARAQMRRALAEWDRPESAATIAECILSHLRQPFTQAARGISDPERLPVEGRWIPFKEAA